MNHLKHSLQTIPATRSQLTNGVAYAQIDCLCLADGAIDLCSFIVLSLIEIYLQFHIDGNMFVYK